MSGTFKTKSKKVRTRFAPSPTGTLHVGGLRTAVYAYALAKRYKGDFILRIEDTDQKRLVPQAKEKLEEILKQFSLTWDEYYVQSERVKSGIYAKAAEKLVRDGHAFYCQCLPRNAKTEGFSKILRDPCRDKNLRTGAIKLKVPENKKVSYRDFVIQKEIIWDSGVVDDATLLKSDGFPTYHLAVVVDDHDMNISHVLRGHDWLPSTPIHLLVYEYLEYDRPEIGHLTDILDPEGGKLSKRKGSVSCEAILAEGYLPEAILNFVMLLGWAPKDDREIFTLEEFVKAFDENGFQKSNPIYNRDKLNWFNGEYIRNSKNSILMTKLVDFFNRKYAEEKLEKIIPLVRERLNTLSEFESLAGFFFELPKADKKLLGENFKEHLSGAITVLEGVNIWNLENINKALMDLIQSKNFKTGKFFMDIRIAITGSSVTPPINESMEILGKDESIKRLSGILN
ncbi:MAG TPA: glutamate--tRNA ligase [Patescibacteria group bacterium]|nr:glutamate--tRNA ligase [Patescibacteria group bacterium]